MNGSCFITAILLYCMAFGRYDINNGRSMVALGEPIPPSSPSLPLCAITTHNMTMLDMAYAASASYELPSDISQNMAIAFPDRQFTSTQLLQDEPYSPKVGNCSVDG